MGRLFGGKPRRPEFVAPPAEYVMPRAQSREAHDQADAIEDADRQLLALKHIPPAQRLASWHRQADRVLDLRLAIRPPRVTQPADVPVIPGRTS
jgi:hypothetical protein